MSLLEQTLDQVLIEDNYPNLFSLIICRQGNTIYERYFSGKNSDALFDIRSSFKSILSLLTGIALEKGYLSEINDQVHHYFSGTPYISYFDTEKKKITIADLLNMKSGLSCEEFFMSSDCETQMEASNDWVQFCMQVAMLHQPGMHWSYCTCNSVITGALLEASTNMRLSVFASEVLFKPLNFGSYQWTTDPSGNLMSGGSFSMQAIDMLKIGQLVLNDGYYDNKKILSADYLTLATSALTRIPDFSFVGNSNLKNAQPENTYYGLCWYSETVHSAGERYTCVFSSGNGGQHILIIKELDLVVTCTQGNFDSRRAKQFFEILISYIIPNVTAESSNA
jgi:CubicO group peptidase (beta-lactamase class C family)